MQLFRVRGHGILSAPMVGENKVADCGHQFGAPDSKPELRIQTGAVEPKRDRGQLVGGADKEPRVQTTMRDCETAITCPR